MKQKLTSLIALALVSGSALAQTAAPAAPEPESTLTFNAGVVSEYRYRGLAQSAKKPALQGGVDYADKSGFYLGAWGSTISWIKDTPTAPVTAKGPIEIDIYGGYKGALSETVSYDIGGLQYWYTGNTLGNVSGFANANTFELYGALSVGAFTAKFSNSLTNTFGNRNSKNSHYIDLSYTLDLGDGLTLVPHVGEQIIKNNTGLNYTDYALTLNKDINGLVLSAAVIGTTFKSRNGADAVLAGSGDKSLSGSTLVLGLKKNF
jgi:uncharacterized protein (TIGR02001 family)